MIDGVERTYLENARIARLGTADEDGRPHVVPICFAVVGDDIVTAIDEKPQQAAVLELPRSRNIRENPAVAVLADHYTEEWSQLGWVLVRGLAKHVDPGSPPHERRVTALRDKYDQYQSHDLEDRPLITIAPGSVQSWGAIDNPDRE